MSKRQGKIIREPGLDIWPHEEATAEALANADLVVEFIHKRNADYKKSADAFIDGTLYEIKAPTSSHLSVVGKNIKKAMRQSMYIVFDSKRMKSARDFQIIRELNKQLAENRKIKSLLFVDKKRVVHRLK